jgi:hypothetical protein
VLEASDEADAAALARLVFSPRIRGSRLRLASRDALLGQYGVTLTAGGRGYVPARNLDRAPRRAEQAVAYLQPRALTGVFSHLMTGRGPRAHVVATVSASGIVVTVRGVRWTADQQTLATHLEQSSAVVGPDGRALSFAQLGLVVRVEQASVHVRPRSSEATIKLTALMARGARLVLTPGRRSDGAQTRVVARLAPPEGDVVKLAAIGSDATPEVEDWCRIRWPKEPMLPRDLRILLARHLPVHDTWFDDHVIDAMLNESSPNSGSLGIEARGEPSSEAPE